LTEELDSGSKWIVSLCSLDCISNAKVTDDFPENLIDMVTDYWFQTIFKEMSLE